MHPATLTWSWLNILTKERYNAILEVFGTLEEGLKHLNPAFLAGLHCRQETIEKTMVRLETFDAAAYAAKLRALKIGFLTLSDDLYPAKLKEIGDPPPFLSYKGDLSVLNQPCIALVGTRAISPMGKRIADLFATGCSRAGMVTVSGLAQGIDAVVARSTITAGGRSVAALGHGLGMIYPQGNARLAEEMLASGGLLISEFPMDIAPDKYTFPARNRIIAGLTLGTVVLEAPKGSGAIITAELALDYNRDVFAVPGPIFDENFAGCNDLIARGHARLVQTPEDVLEEIGVIASTKPDTSTYVPRSSEEETLLASLTTMPQKADELVERTKLDPGTVGATLTMLELAGAAKNAGAGAWVRA